MQTMLVAEDKKQQDKPKKTERIVIYGTRDYKNRVEKIEKDFGVTADHLIEIALEWIQESERTDIKSVPAAVGSSRRVFGEQVFEAYAFGVTRFEFGHELADGFDADDQRCDADGPAVGTPL